MKSKTNRLVENNEIWIELRRPSDVLDNAEPAFHPFSSPLAQHKYDYALLYLNNYQIQHLSRGLIVRADTTAALGLVGGERGRDH